MDRKSNKLLFIGIDGVTWDVLMPLINEGKTPNIARLMEEGVYGELESIEPMMSPVIWTSIATGMMPEKHGITNFYSTQNSLKSPRIWEILSHYGESIGIFEWLLTSPPKPIKHFIVPGWLSTRSDTHPPELEFIKRLTFEGKKRDGNLLSYINLMLKSFKNGLRLSTIIRAANSILPLLIRRPDFYDVIYRKILLKLYIYGDFAVHLLRKYQPDFSAFIFYATDQIPHHYWRFMEPAKFDDVNERDIKRYGDIIRRTYCKTDEVIGRILEVTPDDTTVIILSDHGMEAVTDVKYVFKTERLLDYIDFKERGKVAVQILKNDLHFDINGANAQEKRVLQKRLVESLQKIIVVETNEPLFDVSFDYYGNILARVRLEDLDYKRVLLFSSLNNKRVKLDSLIETERLLSARHARHGVIIMRGKGIRRGYKIDRPSVLDITPTILGLKGLPVGADMDGKVIKEALTEEFLKENPIRYIDSYSIDLNEEQRQEAGSLSEEDMDEVKERLKALGYLD